MKVSELWVICDIDGTISDDRERRYLVNQSGLGLKPNWDLYHEASQYDPPIQSMVDLIQKLSKTCPIVFMTGRPYKYEAITRRWLHNNFPEFDPRFALLMRLDNDTRPSVKVKQEQLEQIFLEKGRKVLLAIDNDFSNVEMFRSKGIPTIYAKKAK